MFRSLAIATALLSISQSATAQGTPALEAPIAAENPCSDLPGIDRLDFIRIDQVTLTAANDTLSASASGAIGCRTSRSAFITSSLAVDVAASVSVSLATCQIQTSDLRLSNIRGSAAPLLDAFRGEAESALLAELVDSAIAACQGLVSP